MKNLVLLCCRTEFPRNPREVHNVFHAEARCTRPSFVSDIFREVVIMPDNTTAMANIISRVCNHTANALNWDNLCYIPPSRQYSLIRFEKALPSHEPYYPTATMGMRSYHTVEISNQINAVEQVLKRRDESESDTYPVSTGSKLRENEVEVNKRRTERN